MTLPGLMDPADLPGFRVEVEPALGGRWRSLVDPDGREWLWSRPDPRRRAVAPGAPFVDVGGVEECIPTIAGVPDHGDAWSRPWLPDGDGGLSVTGNGYRLSRRITAGPVVHADYSLRADPGFRFVWAWHALVDPAVGLRIEAPAGHRVLSWPDGTAAEPRRDRWPTVGATAAFDVAEADDGTAEFCVLPGLDTVRLVDGSATLGLRLHCPQAPVAVGIWRNLGGYSWDGGGPYRSIGVEPMIGWGPVPDTPGGSPGVVPASGELRWRLSIVRA